MNKKFASLGLTLGLAAGGVAGLAFGNPSISGAVTSPSATADATTATDASTTSDRPDPSVRLAEVLAPLVADGTLTQAQLDSVVATLAEAGPIGGGHRGGRGGGAGLEAAATALGLTEVELRTELQGGSTIAEVAAAKGVDVQTVIDAMVASATEHINSEVTSGEITQEEADAKLADLTTRITERVNNAMPEGGGRGRHGHRGGMAPSTDAVDADDSTSTTTG